jgi:hypothetical protein
MNTYLWLIIPTGVVALILLALWVKAMRSRVPWWAESVNKRNAWPSKGSVYAIHCYEIEGIEKVGTTQRGQMTKRMGEIKSKMTGYRPYIHFAIDNMPFAWSVEQEAHRLLKKKRIVFPKGSPMGTEWFSRRSPEELQEIVDAIVMAAKAVRLYAINTNCWPEWANPVLVDLRDGKKIKRPLFTKENSPGLKLAS